MSLYSVWVMHILNRDVKSEFAWLNTLGVFDILEVLFIIRMHSIPKNPILIFL